MLQFLVLLLGWIVMFITTDGIYPILKTRTISFTSDSANVVAGEKSGVGARLSQHFGRSLQLLKCAAHKMELGMNHYEIQNEMKKHRLLISCY